MISNFLKRFVSSKTNERPASSSSSSQSLINELPNDILEEIFFHLSGKDLCQKTLLVCKKWKNLIDNDAFWIEKCLRDKRLTQEKMRVLRDLGHINISAKKFYFSCFSLFEKNFLKNPFGDEMFKYWCFSRNMSIFNVDKFDKEQISKTIKTCKKCLSTPNIDASVLSVWQIQDDQGHGSSHFFDENTKPCRKFATSYTLAEKMQLIDLYDECLIAKDLHLINAKIQVSESYAPRFDCGSKYNLCVFLISDAFELVDEFKFEERFEQWSETHWREAKHLFTVMKPIRYVLFYHSGVDTQFWAGFYGSKMTNGSIRILL
jgi:hypothetical protein